MSDEICNRSAEWLRDAMQRREVSPVEVTQAVLERAHRLQPHLNCFITLCPQEAMREARLAEQKILRGEPLGLLHGVPYTCKDLIDTAHVRTTYGSLVYKNHVPGRDAAVIERMRRAGAILIGKTTTSEFGAKCLTDAPLFGRTRNAWHAERTSGGSSGGTAVAVAVGIAPIGIGTDGGGSTRIPAACNGIVGLKQTLGLVPHSQADDVYGNLTYVTPLGREVSDVRLMLRAIAGEHACDPWSMGASADDVPADGGACSEDLRGVRILFAESPPGRPIAHDVAKAFRAVLAKLDEAGATMAPLENPQMLDVEPIWRVINHTVWKARFGTLVATHGHLLTPSFLQQIALANEFTAVEYQEANFARTRLFWDVQEMFARCDFLIMPTLSRTALPIGQDLFGALDIDGQLYDEVRPNWFPWTMPFNLTGHPAVSIPCGFDRDGLPIGLQIVGRMRQEADLLRMARLIEQRCGPGSCRPDPAKAVFPIPAA